MIDEACWALGRLAARASRRPRGLPELPAPQAPPDVAGYFGARRFLAGAGVAFPRAVEVVTERDLLEQAAGMRYPLVLKALADEHKSDRAGVVLSIADANELVEAWHDLEDRLSPPSCSVEEMHDLSDAVELLVGVRRDPRFGPVVLVGLGGTPRGGPPAMCGVPSAPSRTTWRPSCCCRLGGAALLTGSAAARRLTSLERRRSSPASPPWPRSTQTCPRSSAIPWPYRRQPLWRWMRESFSTAPDPRRETMFAFAMTDEQRSIVDVTRAFVERELYPHEEEVERSGVLRRELAAELRRKALAAGLYAANMPEEVGGAALTLSPWCCSRRSWARPATPCTTRQQHVRRTSCWLGLLSNGSATCSRASGVSASNALR